MAQELLSNSLLHEAIDSLQSDVVAQMKQVSLSDTDAHTRLMIALQQSDHTSRKLWQLIQHGKESEIQLRAKGSRLD